MWADALLQGAEINAKLQDQDETIECFVEHVHVLHSLYLKLQTPPQKLTSLESLLTAVKIVSTKKISGSRKLKA
jgi:hypothetical protein